MKKVSTWAAAHAPTGTRWGQKALSLLLSLALCLTLLPTAAFAEDTPMPQGNAASEEPPSLTPGATYYFDLSGENIPGEKNTALPDASLHYVPFTYAGIIDAYKLQSAMITNEEYAQQNKYQHSLFIADYVVTHTVSWDTLNSENLIFGRSYTGGGVSFTLRAPSVGSDGTDGLERGAPGSNEWDTILDKDSGYIKNFAGKLSLGQDTYIYGYGYGCRGYSTVRLWNAYGGNQQASDQGYRPVLAPDTPDSSEIKAVSLELNGGKLNDSTENISVIVKSGSTFPAPTSAGLTRPDGNTGSYFMWCDSDGNLYAPGDAVSADVVKLTALFNPIDTYSVMLYTNGGTINSNNIIEYTYGQGATLPTAEDMTYAGHTFKGWYDNSGFSGKPVTAISTSDTGYKFFYAKWEAQEQPSLTPGATYYFDLSGEDIPGKKNIALPDTSLHYVPFTYVGIIDAYKLTESMVPTEDYANQNKYNHSLFISDYVVTHTVSWDTLNSKKLIFGSGYTSGGAAFTLRTPSVGKSSPDNGAVGDHGSPADNEWDTILDANSEYIKNTAWMYSWGQETYSRGEYKCRSRRGYKTARTYEVLEAYWESIYCGYRPVLAPDAPDSAGLKVVPLELNGGKLGDSYDAQIVVKNGSTFTAPASEALTRPDGNTDTYFMWLGSDDKFYAPGETVPAQVTKLTALFTNNVFAIKLNTNGGKVKSGKDVFCYTYGVGAVLPAAEDMTYSGHVFEGWYDNSSFSGEPITEISSDATGDKTFYAKWGILEFSLTRGGTYYFDLSGEDIPGIINAALPDTSLHYVPFTYTGTFEAYKLLSETMTTEEDARQNNYLHGLFVADYAVTHTVTWSDLNAKNLIFGKKYASGNLEYSLRAPSVGSWYNEKTGRGTPTNNEWDVILDKNSELIKNWSKMYCWGQDTLSWAVPYHALRGHDLVRKWNYRETDFPKDEIGFRPVLEVINADAVGPGGLKSITLRLNGGKPSESADTIQVIVKSGSTFAAPAKEGLDVPDNCYFVGWSDGLNIYAPGDRVPSDVTTLTAQFTSDTYTVMLPSGDGYTAEAADGSASPVGSGGSFRFTVSISSGYQKGENFAVKANGSALTESDGKYTIYNITANQRVTVEGVEAIPPTPTEHTITVTSGGNGTASVSHTKAAAGWKIALTATPNVGYHFKEWQVISPTGLVITSNKFLMPDGNVEIKAIFEKDTSANPVKPNVSVTGTYIYNGTVHTATVAGYDSVTMDITGNTGTDAGDYNVSVVSKTGKWLDGSTGAVTATWSIGKANQEAPIGLTGIAPTTEGGNDGKITGVTNKMEYRAAGNTVYVPFAGGEIENLPAGSYFVRYAEDKNHFAGLEAEVTVGQCTPLADCTVTFNGNGGSGSMGSMTIKAGSNYILPACGFAAPADQEFKVWEIDGTEYKVGDSYTVNADTEIKALWKNSAISPTFYTITITDDGNGTGTATASTATVGMEIILSANPNKGYHFKEWQVISPTGLVIADNKLIMPARNVEIKAAFEADSPVSAEFTITFDGNGGTSSAGSRTTIGRKLTSLPDAARSGNYRFDGWYTEKTGGEKVTTNTVFSANRTVYAHWIYIEGSSGSYTPSYAVTVEESMNGSATADRKTASRGTTVTITVTPDEDYTLETITVTDKDGNELRLTDKGSGKYTFTMPAGSVTVRATFMDDNTMLNFFVDVKPSDYYYDAVLWAVQNGITSGTDTVHFSPNQPCTRAQTVTFLWRVAGSPVVNYAMNMTDVSEDAYYAEAVRWALSEGITTGTTSTTFVPNETCTRAQAVTFLCRSQKATAAGGMAVREFEDFDSIPAYAVDAVQWALENNVTTGTGDGNFTPNVSCTRAQIAAFLYRAYQGK